MLVISKNKNILFSKVKIDSLCESNSLGLLESLKWAGKRVIPYSRLVWSFEPPGRQQRLGFLSPVPPCCCIWAYSRLAMAWRQAELVSRRIEADCRVCFVHPALCNDLLLRKCNPPGLKEGKFIFRNLEIPWTRKKMASWLAGCTRSCWLLAKLQVAGQSYSRNAKWRVQLSWWESEARLISSAHTPWIHPQEPTHSAPAGAPEFHLSQIPHFVWLAPSSREYVKALFSTQVFYWLGLLLSVSKDKLYVSKIINRWGQVGRQKV